MDDGHEVLPEPVRLFDVRVGTEHEARDSELQILVDGSRDLGERTDEASWQAQA